MERTAISKRLRFEVFKRDRFTCAYCGAHPPQVILEVDHIVPVFTYGTNDIDNLITSCFACNRGKADKSLNDIPQPLNERLSEIKEREAQISGYEEIMREARERLDDQAQEVLNHICEQFSRDSLSKQDFHSIKNFVKLIGLHEVYQAFDIAFAKFPRSYRQCFPYFCGVCWRKIKTAGNA
jgi:HNH endonuclease